MMDGRLAKLTIIPFEDSENVQFGAPAGPPFIAQFNPESFSIANEIELGPDGPAHGDVGEEAKFKSIKPRTFTFEFLLDGTGAAGDRVDVLQKLAEFRLAVGFSGKIHRPRFLVLNWGSFIATSVLENFTVTYKLFRPDGTPLRATLATTFREHKPKEEKEKEKNLSSPDVVHSHFVKEGEHLSLVTYRTYKDPAYYFQVAEANSLDNLRRLRPGTALHFPPVKQVRDA